MVRPHTMTAARRIALRKAQLASAAKRRGRRKKPMTVDAARKRSKRYAQAVAVGIAVAGTAQTIHYKRKHTALDVTLGNYRNATSRIRKG